MIAAVGDSADLLSRYQSRQTVDAVGTAVCSGFVDPHTHTIFGGDRAHEFELRINGASCVEIIAAGSGIVSTMLHMRGASPADLVASATEGQPATSNPVPAPGRGFKDRSACLFSRFSHVKKFPKLTSDL